MKVKRKFEILVVIIFAVMQFGYSQSDNVGTSNIVLKLIVNDGAAISATLEYDLVNAVNDSPSLSFYFHTIRMKKRFFSRCFREVEKIKSYKVIELTNALLQLLNNEKILDFCESEKVPLIPQTDGIYYCLHVSKFYGDRIKDCSVAVDTEVTSKRNSEIGELIKEILSEIQYLELEKEFREELPKGYYQNHSHYYWKKK